MKLGDVVMRKNGVNHEYELCEVFSMLNEPSAGLENATGERCDWAQSLTRPATAEETVAYWKAKAESWKKRAAQHGCNTVEGDHECG